MQSPCTQERCSAAGAGRHLISPCQDFPKREDRGQHPRQSRVYSQLCHGCCVPPVTSPEVSQRSPSCCVTCWRHLLAPRGPCPTEGQFHPEGCVHQAGWGLPWQHWGKALLGKNVDPGKPAFSHSPRATEPSCCSCTVLLSPAPSVCPGMSPLGCARSSAGAP